MSIVKSTCIVGIGNNLRGDDAVGKYVAEAIEKNNLPGISIIATQQLDMGLAEDLSKFDTVIFIDASLNEKTFSFAPLELGDHTTQSISHHINADLLVRLTQQLFSTPTRFYMCAIGASNFEMGNGISAATKANADAAITAINNWLAANA